MYFLQQSSDQKLIVSFISIIVEYIDLYASFEKSGIRPKTEENLL